MNVTILMRMGRIAGWLVLVVASALGSAAWAAGRPTPEESLRVAVESYTPRSASAAKQDAADAFFAFEGSTLDRELAAREPSLYREVESQWMRLLADMDAGRPQEAVRLQGAHVLELLERGSARRRGGEQPLRRFDAHHPARRLRGDPHRLGARRVSRSDRPAIAPSVSLRAEPRSPSSLVSPCGPRRAARST